MAQKIVLPENRRFTPMSKHVTRSVLVSLAAKLCDMGNVATAQHLLNLDHAGWQSVVIALLEQSHAILHHQQKADVEIRLTEARIMKGLSRKALADRLQSADKSLRVEETTLFHLENSEQARKEFPPAWKAALSKFFNTSWEELSQPIRQI